MFLWSLEVQFPHPANTYTVEENDRILAMNILIKEKEKARRENEKEINKENENDVIDNSDNNNDNNDDGNDDDIDNNIDQNLINMEKEIKNENSGISNLKYKHQGYVGNTSSGIDLYSLENILLINDNIQLREEMYGIENRKIVCVQIDEPLYYEIFRQCHHDEWLNKSKSHDTNIS